MMFENRKIMHVVEDMTIRLLGIRKKEDADFQDHGHVLEVPVYRGMSMEEFSAACLHEYERIDTPPLSDTANGYSVFKTVLFETFSFLLSEAQLSKPAHIFDGAKGDNYFAYVSLRPVYA